MAIIFKSSEQCASEYLIHLKGLRPDIDTSQVDSDWIIRGKTIGGTVSGLYGDQALLSDDPFPQSARHEAIGKHLKTYFNRDFNAPTQAQGDVLITAATGSDTLPAGTVFTYEPNGNAYISLDDYEPPSDAVTGLCAVQSVDTGQAQNLLEGAELTITDPPAGYETVAVVTGDNIADGTDAESDDHAKDELLAVIRNPIRGGADTDWEVWAKEASPSVTKASVVPHLHGLGTVGVVISSGTADIDTALDNGDAVIFVPSDDLIDIVQAYLDAKRATTDCAYAIKVTEVEIDVTVYVSYKTGDGSTIPSGQTLTQNQLVEREIKRALYKSAQGGRSIAGSTDGYIVGADIEDQLDTALSAGPTTIGPIPILDDRAVADLSLSGRNVAIDADQQAVPGTITIIEES